MNFNIDQTPPSADVIEQERNVLVNDIKRLTTRDTIITFVIIFFSSAVLGLVVYWYTNSYKYAGISVSIFPVLGTFLSLLGITKSIGFRSAANRISELQSEVIELTQVLEISKEDIKDLCTRHMTVFEYHEKVLEQNRDPVNGELAMFWEFDSSTQANTARGRDLLNKAKDSVSL
jgi:hypothetical protein